MTAVENTATVEIPHFEGLRLPIERARRLYAELSRFLSPHKRQLFERNVRFRTRHLTVVLEDIYQSHNASACLRSCDGFGVQDVHIIEQRYAFRPNRDIALGSTKWLTLYRYGPQTAHGTGVSSPPLPSVSGHADSDGAAASNRASASAGSTTQQAPPDAIRQAGPAGESTDTERAHTERAVDPRARRAADGDSRPAGATARCFQRLRGLGYRIVVTAPRADATPLEEYDVTQKTALVFGTELEGATEYALDAADELLSIPMYGFTESFNISVAVAICLHHLVWKLHHSDAPWRLPDHECLAVQLQWAHSVLRKRWGPLVERLLRELTDAEPTDRQRTP